MGVCVFFASGRTVAFDARSQLTQAVHFCSTGQIAARHKLSGDFVPKDFNAASGAWYDANDIGGTLLMLPAACASTLVGARNPGHPSGLTTIAKAGSSLTFALVGGIGAALVFLTLARLLGDRRGWWWTIAFLFTTAYLAYVKGVWNVLPAATAVAGLMYAVSCQFPARDGPESGVPGEVGHPGRILAGAATGIGLASLCRYSLLPFLLIASGFALWPTLRRATWSQRLGALGLLVLLLLPDLWFNALRSGRFWVPGESAPQFIVIHITPHYLVSTLGMFFGIQRGLFFYAPACLLGYIATLALGWRAHGYARIAWLGVLATSVAYAITVVLLHNWYVYGWGPRYLVPLMPVLFVATAVACERRTIPRVVAYASIAFGALTQFPVAFTNWHALLAVVGVEGRAPDGIVGLWRAFLRGIRTGQSFGSSEAHRALQVPDTWWWHALGNHPPYLLGVIIAVAGLVTLLTIGARRVRPPSPAGAT
jgi:hypothetical protein